MENKSSSGFQEVLKNLLRDTKYFVEGEFNKSVLLTDVLTDKEELLSILLKEQTVKEHFFKEVMNVTIFLKEKFIDFIQLKEFLPNSYTAFSNKIGLNLKGKPLSKVKDVVLDFPYKDCVLEGGQDKEDQKRDEIFYNETLAPDEIDRLFEPKAFTNFKIYDQNGEHEPELNHDFSKDNLIIKGNNLLALHSILGQYRSKVKLIYIDPPYNNGVQSFHYNDQFNRSTWLTFMFNRLCISKELLSENGSIWINIDDKEAHYLKVLCDEIFGMENFVANIIWQKKHTRANDAKYFSDNHDHILVFAKNRVKLNLNLLPRTDKMDQSYSNPDNDPRGKWASQPIQAKTLSKDYIYEITTPMSKEFSPPKGRSWQFTEKRYQELVKDNRIWFGEEGLNVPRVKNFLSEVQDGLIPVTIWCHQEVGHNQEAKGEINKLSENIFFDTPKPERLLERIIHIGSNKVDIILDYHLGSGTTAAVAHKMGRRYIGIEQMDYIETITVKRLQKVIGSPKKTNGKMFDELEYDKGGISESVGWKGGGSFTYFELAEFNQVLIEKIQFTKDTQSLLPILEDIGREKQCYQCFEVEMKSFDKQDFSALSLEDQKRILIQCLDKNHLYVGLPDMKDAKYNLSEEDIELNKAFYREEVGL